jgi:hypothetical protein
MNLQKLVLIGLLLLAPLATLSAQNSLPNPHDDSCWSSLSALRACQIQAYNEAQAYQQNCTSYPEYQCFDYYQPQQKTAGKHATKADSNASNAAPATTATPGGVSNASVQTSSAN